MGTGCCELSVVSCPDWNVPGSRQLEPTPCGNVRGSKVNLDWLSVVACWLLTVCQHSSALENGWLLKSEQCASIAVHLKMEWAVDHTHFPGGREKCVWERD